MRDSLKLYREKFLSLDRNLKIALVAGLLATMCAIFFDFHSESRAAETSQNGTEVNDALDTFIPAGFSLVPIEIVNSSGMDSILGRYGAADLFKEGQKSAFMRNVRLVRGLDEGGPWAALVPSQYATELLASGGGRFFVAVKGRGNSKTVFDSKRDSPKRVIIYEGE